MKKNNNKIESIQYIDRLIELIQLGDKINIITRLKMLKNIIINESNIGIELKEVQNDI